MALILVSTILQTCVPTILCEDLHPKKNKDNKKMRLLENLKNIRNKRVNTIQIYSPKVHFRKVQLSHP